MVLFLYIYISCEYVCVPVHACVCVCVRACVCVCVCVSCCVHTLLLMSHTIYIYDATQDIHVLANSAAFGFNFLFFLGKRNSGPS